MIPEEAYGRTRWPERWSGYDRSDVEALQGLVAEGVEKGFLTYDEIAAVLEDVVLKPEQIEDFYTYLLDRSVELVEGSSASSRRTSSLRFLRTTRRRGST